MFSMAAHRLPSLWNTSCYKLELSQIEGKKRVEKRNRWMRFSQRYGQKTWDGVTWAVHTERRRRCVCLHVYVCVCVFTSIPGLYNFVSHGVIPLHFVSVELNGTCVYLVNTSVLTLVCVIKGATSTTVRWKHYERDGGERCLRCSDTPVPAGAPRPHRAVSLPVRAACSSDGRNTPSSVMMPPVISWWGVTSNAGFHTSIPTSQTNKENELLTNSLIVVPLIYHYSFC